MRERLLDLFHAVAYLVTYAFYWLVAVLAQYWMGALGLIVLGVLIGCNLKG